MQTTMSSKPKIVNPGDPPTQNVLGVFVDQLVGGQDTDGQYSAYRMTVPSQVGPPPHSHDAFDEAFFVVSGQVEVMVEGESKLVGPGAYVYVPRGAVHTFRNPGATEVQLLGVATPSGHETFFDEADKLSAGGGYGVEEVLALCQRNGIRVAIPN